MTTITDDTPATLAQHKVQAGDVVRGPSGRTFTVGVNSLGKLCDAYDNVPLLYDAPWTVVSRANPASLPHGRVRLSDGRVVDLTAEKMLPFGMLDAETQKAILRHGGPCQVYDSGRWVSHPIPSFSMSLAYRVAPLPPAPKVETVTLDGWLFPGGSVTPYSRGSYDDEVKVRVTLNRIDGKPDLSSYKLEER